MATAPDHWKTRSLPSAARALEVLERIASARSGLKFTHITRQLPYPRSSLHALLLTLERCGFVQRTSARGTFMPGPRLMRLSSQALTATSLTERAARPMRVLMQRSGMAVQLGVLDGDQVTIAAQAAPATTKTVTFQGQRMAWHCTALGKALAAYLPESLVEEMLRSHALFPHNENTIISPRKISTELAATRHRGYALDNEENMIGYRCLGAPIFDVRGYPCAALSVMGTVEQISDERIRPLAEDLCRAADRVSEMLGAEIRSGQREECG